MKKYEEDLQIKEKSSQLWDLLDEEEDEDAFDEESLRSEIQSLMKENELERKRNPKPQEKKKKYEEKKKEEYKEDREALEDEFEDESGSHRTLIGIVVSVCVVVLLLGVCGRVYLQKSNSDNALIKKLQQTFGIERKDEKVEEKEEEEVVVAVVTETPKPATPTPVPLQMEEMKLDYEKTYRKATGFYTVKTDSAFYAAEDLEEINSSVAEQLPENLLVAVMEKKTQEEESWCHISYLGLTGWIKESDLELVGKENYMSKNPKTYINIPLNEKEEGYSERKGTGESICKFSYGDEVDLEETKEGWAKVKTSDGKSCWIPVTSLYPYVSGYYYVNAGENNSMNVRSEASVNSEVVTMVSSNRVFEISEFKNGWGKILVSGKPGWVNLHYMTPCKKDYVGAESEEEDEPDTYENHTTQTNQNISYETPAPDPEEPEPENSTPVPETTEPPVETQEPEPEPPVNETPVEPEPEDPEEQIPEIGNPDLDHDEPVVEIGDEEE